MALRDNPKFRNLLKQRRKAARSGNQKAFSNLTNKLRASRGRSPLSDAQKAKMFKRQSAKFGGQPDNTTFNRRPLPGGGRIMKGPQQIQEIQAPNRMQPGRLRKPGQPDNTTFNRPNMPRAGGGRIMKGPQQIQEDSRFFNRPSMPSGGLGPLAPSGGLQKIQAPNVMQPGRPRQQGPNNMPGMGRPVLFKDGGEVESMPMGERPYKEEKGKKNSMRGVGKAIQGTKFKGVF